jgi:hypothetical protein
LELAEKARTKHWKKRGNAPVEAGKSAEVFFASPFPVLSVSCVVGNVI